MTAGGSGTGVRASRLLACSAQDAWVAATDVRGHERWIPMTRIDAPAHLGVGGRFTGVSGPGARRGGPGLRDAMVVERLDPPEPWPGTVDGDAPAEGVAVYRKLGPVLLGDAEVRVRALGPAVCEVTWVERVHLRGPRAAARWWVPLTARLVAVPLHLMLRLALHRMARELTG